MHGISLNYMLTDMQDRGPPRRYDDRRGGPRDRYDVSKSLLIVGGRH